MVDLHLRGDRERSSVKATMPRICAGYGINPTIDQGRPTALTDRTRPTRPATFVYLTAFGQNTDSKSSPWPFKLIIGASLHSGSHQILLSELASIVTPRFACIALVPLLALNTPWRGWT